MLKLRKGCKVPLNEKLFEGYEKKDNYIHANVDSDKIIDVLNHFIVMHEEPLFFILELPTKLNDENIVQPSVIECLHKDAHLITAWDTFTEDYPGKSERIVTDGRDVFDIPEMCKEYGMYFAERREE